MPRDTADEHLHPAFLAPLLSLEAELELLRVPLRRFEGARGPSRQAALYSIGRVTGVGQRGKTKTRARAWESNHQYCVAADLVFYLDGLWTWEEPEAGMWGEYRRRAEAHGLHLLSFEEPHCELPISRGALEAGDFPPSGGDERWRAWMETEAERWGVLARGVNGLMQPGAPPALLGLLHARPDLPDVA